MMPEISVATAATHSEVRIARMKTSLWKKTSYQRKASACGGTAGREGGSIARMEVGNGEARGEREADSGGGCLPWIAAMTGRIMEGRKAWVRAMTMPKELYISGTGRSARPMPTRVRLISPL